MLPTTPSLDRTASVQTPSAMVPSTKRRGAVSIIVTVDCAGVPGGAIGPSSNGERRTDLTNALPNHFLRPPSSPAVATARPGDRAGSAVRSALYYPAGADRTSSAPLAAIPA